MSLCLCWFVYGSGEAAGMVVGVDVDFCMRVYMCECVSM